MRSPSPTTLQRIPKKNRFRLLYTRGQKAFGLCVMEYPFNHCPLSLIYKKFYHIMRKIQKEKFWREVKPVNFIILQVYDYTGC